MGVDLFAEANWIQHDAMVFRFGNITAQCIPSQRSGEDRTEGRRAQDMHQKPLPVCL